MPKKSIRITKMNFWFISILAIVSLPSPISGVNDDLKNRIIESYGTEEKSKLMFDGYTTLNDLVMMDPRVDPCVVYKKHVFKIHSLDPKFANVRMNIITGDFDDNNGYRLIIDPVTTIDIPAVIECVPKDAFTGDHVKFINKVFVYYLILYEENGNYTFDMVTKSKEMDKMKTVFILGEAEVLVNFLETYTNNTRRQKRDLKAWFQNIRNRTNGPKEECENFFDGTKLMEPFPAELKSRNGTVSIKPYFLRLTDDVEIELIGIVKCVVEVKNKCTKKSKTETRYFTLANLESNKKNGTCVLIYGPDIRNKTTFALRSEFLSKVK